MRPKPAAAPAAPQSTQSPTTLGPVSIEILIGPPGSGKSTYAADKLAKSLANALSRRVSTVSADDFFEGEDGVYRFDPSKIGEAHAACLRDFIKTLSYASQSCLERTIVVDNTNTTTHEIAVYYAVAKAFGADVHLVYFNTHPDACIQRNTHGVPEAVVLAMWQAARDLDPLPYWQVTETVITDHKSYAQNRVLP